MNNVYSNVHYHEWVLSVPFSRLHFIHKCDVLVEAKTAVDDSDTFTNVLLSLFELDYYYEVGTAEKNTIRRRWHTIFFARLGSSILLTLVSQSFPDSSVFGVWEWFRTSLNLKLYKSYWFYVHAYYRECACVCGAIWRLLISIFNDREFNFVHLSTKSFETRRTHLDLECWFLFSVWNCVLCIHCLASQNDTCECTWSNVCLMFS